MNEDRLIRLKVETTNAVAAARLMESLVGRCRAGLSASPDGVWRVDAAASPRLARQFIEGRMFLPRDAHVTVGVDEGAEPRARRHG